MSAARMFANLTRRATMAETFRAWCRYRSDAVFRQDGKRSALLRILAEI